MKLYVWRGKGVLQNYSSGIAFALAESLEQAIMEVKRSFILAFQDIYWIPNVDMEDEDFRSDVERHLQFLNDPPEIFDSPIGFFKEGGE
jgi:hypothetical protein